VLTCRVRRRPARQPACATAAGPDRPRPLDRRLLGAASPHNGERTLPSQYEHLEATGTVDNFRRAAGKLDGEFHGHVLRRHRRLQVARGGGLAPGRSPDDELRRMVDEVDRVEVAARSDRTATSTPTSPASAPTSAGRTSTCTRCTAPATCSRRPSPSTATTGDRRCSTSPTASPTTSATPSVQDRAARRDRRARGGRARARRALPHHRHPALPDQARSSSRPAAADCSADRTTASTPAYARTTQPFRDLDAVAGHAVRALYYAPASPTCAPRSTTPATAPPSSALWRNMTERRGCT
jgi:uncharacterized protein